jgi:hypothetical protein
MFLSIINESFHRTRQNQNNDQEIFSFMLKKFLRWSSLKKPNELEIAEERDIQICSRYFNAIEIFPDKVNQLYDALERVCFHYFF